jgi:hypothetical protein
VTEYFLFSMGTREFYPKNFFFFVPGLQYAMAGEKGVEENRGEPAGGQHLVIMYTSDLENTLRVLIEVIQG